MLERTAQCQLQAHLRVRQAENQRGGTLHPLHEQTQTRALRCTPQGDAKRLAQPADTQRLRVRQHGRIYAVALSVRALETLDG